MKKKKIINYKKTINLPKINFPMKANLNIKENKILKKWKKNNLYYKIREKKKNKKKFILHDGPPYANGNIHIGHAYNKILKDIILKYKNLMNLDTPYIPGWDCHGLPIELEIQKKNKIKLNSKKNIYIFKKKCKEYADIQINNQKKDFIRLGILADWKNIYKTMDFKYISNTIKILSKIIKLNLLERKKKPTNWCINCKSSLADAEIEYIKKKSNSIYILFKIFNKNILFKNIKNKKKINKNKNIYFIIWTTTIWTIPGNCAISINPKFIYSLIENKKNIYIILKNKKKSFIKKINIKFNNIYNIYGKFFKKIYVYHPISKKKTPLIFNKNIKKDTGTGIVHIASEHGEEDNLISKKYNINGLNVINKNGKYIKYKYIKKIEGCKIYNAEKLILKKIIKNKKLIFQEIIIHKYPHCWRHKTPIILKSTSQWFINLNKNNLKKKVIKNIKNIKWIPIWGYKKIKKMILNRPNWCISRQRTWGIPIPIFINKKTKKLHPKTLYLMNKISNKIKIFGPNYWLNIKKKNFLGKEHKKYKKILDTLDIWFDSGSTCFSIMNPKFKKKKYIDLYLEGSDQYRGWFMSSLIIYTAINNCAPCKIILSHGFIVNDKGKKMSKSLKNNLHPNKIINKFGADILRLWVSSTNFTNDIHISEEIILRITELYRKIRNTIKFLVSNLDKFNPNKNIINKKKMILIDKWIIHKTKKTQDKIINLYKNFKFYKIIKIIINYCVIDLSSLYLDIIKDRKYTIKKNTIPFYSAQTTMWMILESIIKWILPILSFTAEEIWKYLPRKKNNSIYEEKWFNKLFKLHKNNKINENIWKKLIIIRVNFNKIIEKMKLKKIINSSLEIKAKIYLEKNFFNIIKKMKLELKYFFIISKITLKIINKKKYNNFFKIKCSKYKGIKCQRCWHYTKKNNNTKNYSNICNRCIKNIFGKGEKRKFI